MRKLFILLVLFCSTSIGEAQSFEDQKRKFAFVNIGLNGIASGIGAVINKNEGQNSIKVFFKGFSQGCLGGSFQVLGKESSHLISSRQNLSYAWISRITNSVGNSIVLNASNNVNFWESWHFNLYFLRLNYDLKSKQFDAKVFPSFLVGAITSGYQAKLNLTKTLQIGIMVYERDGLVSLYGSQTNGLGVVSSIAVNRNVQGQTYFNLMAHETMHILQYDNLVWLNSYSNKLDKKLRLNNELYEKLSKYIYLDFNGLTLYGLYLSQKNRPWECRYIEREADFYSVNRIWPDCK